jgi:SAM-dependent methyltransferase
VQSQFLVSKMAPLALLPATTYRPPSPGQVPRRRRSLNTIMEDDEESMKALSPRPTPRFKVSHDQYVRADWLSPLSDHFPTPRGHHFMVAPIVPASPSSATESEADSTPWTRNSVTTNATDFDDLYDVSDDEENRKIARARLARSSSRSSTSSRLSGGSLPGQRLPSLVTNISSTADQWAITLTPSKLLFSPVPPTPPPKVPMSPAIYRYLSTHQDTLSLSAAPSLDGSMSSEQLSAMSAPPTPDLGTEEGDTGEGGWGGVQLQPDAMATLQALSGEDFQEQPEQVIEIAQMSPTREMQQSPPPAVSSIHRNDSIILSPDQQRSLNSLTKLEIPSPGGFFSALSPNSRYTWHVVPMAPLSPHPPSSSTAEHFYKTPWTIEPVVERIVEISETGSEGCPTARPTLLQQDSDETIREFVSPEAEEELDVDEIIGYENDYARKLRESADEFMDRTGLWLSAQTTYMAALINPPEERDDEVAIVKRSLSTKQDAAKALVSAEPAKKSVRFSEFITTTTATIALGCPLPKPGRLETAYFRAFQNYAKRARYRDTYVHCLPRFEAIQTQRVTFPEAHRRQLLGKYQLSVVPMSEKKKRESANVARGDETPPDDAEKLKREKEFEATEQMRGATWNVMAAKMLNGGRLIAAPVAKRLARLSSMGPTANGTPRDRARILDLGGQATCDWAWHCALEYPNTKVYTVTTKAIRQLSNSNIRGPKNHRQVAVNKLTRLPFRNNQFDLISCRNLYTILKTDGENGEDEYAACLAECMRILKPGGYLEFNVLDSDLVNAGALGQAKSVEFGFSLKRRGYDPLPTKAWIGRLEKAGFVAIKRAWMFLPMGAPTPEKPDRNSNGEEVKVLEAMVTGSTNAAAGITGLLGGWAWERWMLKLQMESAYKEESLLEGVYDIVEEGRRCGAGWRSLNGYARKAVR